MWSSENAWPLYHSVPLFPDLSISTPFLGCLPHPSFIPSPSKAMDCREREQMCTHSLMIQTGSSSEHTCTFSSHIHAQMNTHARTHAHTHFLAFCDISIILYHYLSFVMFLVMWLIGSRPVQSAVTVTLVNSVPSDKRWTHLIIAGHRGWRLCVRPRKCVYVSLSLCVCVCVRAWACVFVCMCSSKGKAVCALRRSYCCGEEWSTSALLQTADIPST